MAIDDLARLEQRLRALEDIHAIQELKARYFRSCDRKQPDQMRDCFLPEGVVIEADGFPPFKDREGWVQLFTQLAVNNPNVMDMHHGQNPQITLTGPDTARGLWDLHFSQINVKERTVVEMAGEYRDEYLRRDGRWWIKSSVFRQTSFQMRKVDEQGRSTVLALGKPPTTPFIENA
ncbi:MAG: nuclear transport factor 2 family protein [Nevskia sp.]|nr:nuclear transport factor 2 family protein [Nevskia sp.]